LQPIYYCDKVEHKYNQHIFINLSFTPIPPIYVRFVYNPLINKKLFVCNANMCFIVSVFVAGWSRVENAQFVELSTELWILNIFTVVFDIT